ncbi:hypothetical protein D3C71_1992410 [compost metagenome]
MSPRLSVLASLMQNSKHLYLALCHPIGHNERDPVQHQLPHIRYLGCSAGAGEPFQLIKGVQDTCHDMAGGVRADQSTVMLMNGVQITLGFLGQCDSRHGLPT